MIRIKTIWVLLFSVIFFSCSDDDNSQGTPPEEPVAENPESISLDVNETTENLQIEGATLLSGQIPEPSGDLSFDLGYDSQSSFQSVGYDISFEAPDNLGGAYLQLVNADGSRANSYLDITADNLTSRRPNGGITGARSIANRTQEITLEIGFSEDVDPGTFCYEMSIYDTEGSISAPVSVCVVVESWGGLSDLIGDWSFDRKEPDTDVANLYYFQCDATMDPVESELVDEELVLTFNEDGSYTRLFEREFQVIDIDGSESACEAVYNDSSTINLRMTGFWAYIDAEEVITVIDFSQEDLLDSSANTEYEDGFVFYDNVDAQVNEAGELVISETYLDKAGVENTIRSFYTRVQ